MTNEPREPYDEAKVVAVNPNLRQMLRLILAMRTAVGGTFTGMSAITTFLLARSLIHALGPGPFTREDTGGRGARLYLDRPGFKPRQYSQTVLKGPPWKARDKALAAQQARRNAQ